MIIGNVSCALSFKIYRACNVVWLLRSQNRGDNVIMYN